MLPEMKFTAAGDALIQRRIPSDYEGFSEIVSEIEKGDMRFFNLETTIHRYETYGNVNSGGSWLCAAPEMLQDMKRFGFNITTSANNHTMDFAHEGIVKTLSYLQEAELLQAGVGMNMAQASDAVYLDFPQGRIGVIGTCSTFTSEAMAGEQSRSTMGRPGLNGIRFKTEYRVKKEELDALKKVAEATQINGYEDLVRKEGYRPELQEGEFEFGGIMFREGDQPGKETSVHPADMKRVEKSIYGAQLQADYIVVSIHSHEIKGVLKEEPSKFLEEFAHRCIDAGAHAVVGHGPHLLRPIEIYKGCPIFYSLGDFILQNENIPRAPADFFETYGLPSDETMHTLFKTRSKDFTRGLQTDPKMLETVIPYWEMKDGTLEKLTLLAVDLGFGLPHSRVGSPRPAKDSAILERLAKMSEPYGTKFVIDGNRAEIIVK